MKKKIAIIMGCVLVVIIGICSYIFLNSKGKNEEVSKVVENTSTDDTFTDDVKENQIKVGESDKLTEFLVNSNKLTVKSYQVKEEGIISISENFEVTALQEGTVSVEVTYEDDSKETVEINVVTELSKATTSKSSLNRVYILSLMRGNAQLFRSIDKKGRTIYGLLDAGNQNTSYEDNCGLLVKEIQLIIGKNNKLQFFIPSNMNDDYAGCANEVLTNINVENLYMKDYNTTASTYSTGSTITSGMKKVYNTSKKIIDTAVNRKTNVYIFKSDGIINGKFTIPNYEEYTKGVSLPKAKENIEIVNIADTSQPGLFDANKSFAELTFGNFKLKILNLYSRYPLDERFNSLVVYAEVNNFKAYFAGNIYNDYAGTYKTSFKYDKNKFVREKNNFSDFYAWYISNEIAKLDANKKLDVLVAPNHGLSRGFSYYVINTLTNNKTKIAFTAANNGFISSYKNGSIVNCYDEALIYESAKDVTAPKYGCKNDIIVNRILNARAGVTKRSKNVPKTFPGNLTIYYQNRFTYVKKQRDILKFGFDFQNVTTGGGYGTKVQYTSFIENAYKAGNM